MPQFWYYCLVSSTLLGPGKVKVKYFPEVKHVKPSIIFVPVLSLISGMTMMLIWLPCAPRVVVRDYPKFKHLKPSVIAQSTPAA